MEFEKNASKYIPLTEATYYILISLTMPLHGYGVMQKIEEFSKGRVNLGAGTLYGALSKLDKEGLIIQTENDNSDRRKNYTITEIGKQVIKLEVKRLKELVDVGEIVINGIGG